MERKMRALEENPSLKLSILNPLVEFFRRFLDRKDAMKEAIGALQANPSLTAPKLKTISDNYINVVNGLDASNGVKKALDDLKTESSSMCCCLNKEHCWILPGSWLVSPSMDFPGRIEEWGGGEEN